MAEFMLSPSPAPLRQIKAMQFGVMSPDQIKSMSPLTSTVEGGKHVPPGITQPVTVNELGQPVYGGLSDPRMGDLDDLEDAGQFGFIELACPVYHVGFMNVIVMLLRCIGYHSRKLLYVPGKDDAQFRRLKGKRRLHYLVKHCEKITHDQSGGYQPRFRRDGLKILVDFSDNPSRSAAMRRKRELAAGQGNLDAIEEDLEEEVRRDQDSGKREIKASEVREILQDLSDEDCRLLGFDPVFSRPSWLIYTVLPVPPPHVRPSVAMNASQRCEDDITFQLSRVVKDNLSLKQAVETSAPQHVRNDKIDALQFSVATLVDNCLPYAPRATQKSGKPLKTLRQRLVGKEGRVRGNLMGKRVDFTARSVITADPNLSIDQLGVPRSIAQHMTVPERVTAFNKERLRELVRNGPNIYPGARYVVKDGLRTDLRHSSKEIVLRTGDIVERHLMNDDVVLFNRQPSLHKMSIMGHRVRVLPWSTFRLNLSVTTPYNADFDGDEMNMHVPQSLTARAEAESLMMVNKVIVSAQSNRPVMGIVQDALLASSLMTRRDVFINKELLFNTLCWLENFNGDIPIPAVQTPVANRPGERNCYWTGKQVFSLVIPKVINQDNLRSNGHNKEERFEELSPFDTVVLIEEGEVLCGMIDKKTLGNAAGTLIHVVCNECGPEVARIMFNQIQKVVNYWILQRSYTVGVGDTIADVSVLDSVRAILDDARVGVADIVKKAQRGLMETQPGRTLEEAFEDYVNMRLNNARDDAGKKAERSISSNNGFKGTVQAGSKGSLLNIAQIMTCVGQQNVDGRRIPYGFERRTLPHFSKDDLGPESRGFVENSYLNGLTPQEFFFHAMGGRVGLIDTACKTAETGYIQRRLVKALEDVSVHYDGTVRNGRGEIIQFLYGEDGMDGSFIESQTIEMLTWMPEKMCDMFKFEVESPNLGLYKGAPFLEASVIEQIRKSPEIRRILEEEFLQLEADKEQLLDISTKRDPDGGRNADKGFPLPVNIARMVFNAKKRWKVDMNKPSDLNPKDVVLKVRALCSRLIVVAGTDVLSQEAQQNATLLFLIHLRSSLASKLCTREYRLNELALDSLLTEVETRFFVSLASPGEMCGVLAAQSIGEPATQMTLNTFHQAGVSSKNMTLGVPRLKEIINVSKNAKTPSVTVYLTQEARFDREEAERVLNRIEFATLRSFCETVEIVYDPFPFDPEEDGVSFTSVAQDQTWVNANYELAFLQGEAQGLTYDNLGSFVLRLVLDGAGLRYKNMKLEEIAHKIYNQFKDPGEFELIHSNDEDAHPVLRIRLRRNYQSSSSDRRDRMQDMEMAVSENEEEEKLTRMSSILLDDMVLRGVRGIPKVFIRKGVQQKWQGERGFSSVEEWILDTDGANLKDILVIEGVDHKRTFSNDILQTIEVLGIEGTRRNIFNEMRLVLSFDGSYVNYRHLALLVDVMTSKGFIMAITRHGVNRTQSGALMRASFEETVEILMEAAAFSEVDPLSGVSENIMMGKLAPVGSGLCQIVLDEDVLAANALDIVEEEEELYLGSSSLYGGNGLYDGGAGGARTPDAATPSYYNPSSPGTYGAGAFSPITGSSMFSPGGGGARSPGASTSPGYNPNSPRYSPSSPAYSPSSPAYSPSSPAYSPSSPAYSPSSPAYSPSSPAYSPSSPAYSPSSPAYSPSSPAYSPSSPAYSPSSPAYSPSSPAYSPSSPAYSPSSPAYSPSSPAYSPSSPAYSPSSPAYSPSSPAYSPSSPAYSPSSPAYAPTNTTGYVPRNQNNNQKRN